MGRAVERIQRVVARHRDRDLLDGLTHIGVDELSYRRHHEYITVVVDHTRGHVIWAKPGKNADTLKAFSLVGRHFECGNTTAHVDSTVGGSARYWLDDSTWEPRRLRRASIASCIIASD
jgi:hypothetical protein